MKKFPKAILILFVAVNVVGGTFLGVRDYLEEREAKKMFADFYSGPEVKGAYDEKTNNIISYVVKGALVLPVLVAGGIFYYAVRKNKAKDKPEEDKKS